MDDDVLKVCAECGATYRGPGECDHPLTKDTVYGTFVRFKQKPHPQTAIILRAPDGTETFARYLVGFQAGNVPEDLDQFSRLSCAPMIEVIHKEELRIAGVKD